MAQKTFGGWRDSTLEDLNNIVCGKKIIDMRLDANTLKIDLAGGLTIELFDDGQDCCESRYMTCDGDELSYFTGAELRGFSLRSADVDVSSYDVHEIEFLVVNTDRGEQVFANHNEHNGYYGGFAIKATLIDHNEGFHG